MWGFAKPAAAASLAAAALFACAPVDDRARSAASDLRVQQFVAGKVAGPPASCLPSYSANDMIVIDGRTLSFRSVGNTTHIVHLTEGCSHLTSGGALLTKSFGGGGLCRGDIAQVIDTSSQMISGSCAIREIIPYRRP